jgi:hypothetical protein
VTLTSHLASTYEAMVHGFFYLFGFLKNLNILSITIHFV